MNTRINITKSELFKFSDNDNVCKHSNKNRLVFSIIICREMKKIQFSFKSQSHNIYVLQNTDEGLEVIKNGKIENTIVRTWPIMQRHAGTRNYHSSYSGGLYTRGGPVNSSGDLP